MKKQTIFLLLIINLCFHGLAFSISSIDSIGVTVKNGQKYIVHQVEAGETLYALSRNYNVGIDLIKEVNGQSINNLSVGQQVMIPLVNSIDPNEGKVHTVGPSETLYSISRQYDVQVEDLKAWNDLNQNSISIGQQLLIKEGSNNAKNNSDEVAVGGQNTHTVKQSETLYSISKMYNLTTDQLKEWNQLLSNSLDVGQILVVSKSGSTNATNESNSSMLPSTSEQTPEANSTESIEIEEAVAVAATANVIPDLPNDYSKDDLDEDSLEKPADKVVEKGLAEVIASTSDTKKYLALHRQAPIGTIMQVRNEMNGQSVFVRIVGSIQDTGDNSKVMLMISKKAFDRLGAIDKRFPVQVSYIP